MKMILVESTMLPLIVGSLLKLLQKIKYTKKQRKNENQSLSQDTCILKEWICLKKSNLLLLKN